jgi:putative transposase
LLRREGCRVNHKLVCRIYKEEGLEVRTKKRRKRVRALRVVLPAATVPNERWSMDFVSDSLHDGRRFRALTIVDHFTRESPAIEVGNSIPGRRVVAVLERLAKVHGLPQVITTDNGTELPLEPWTNGPIGTG